MIATGWWWCCWFGSVFAATWVLCVKCASNRLAIWYGGRGGRWAGTRQPSRPNPLHASTACAQLIHPDCASVFLRPQMVDIIIINFFFLCVAIVGRTSAIVCLNEGSSLCPMHQWWASTAMDTITNWFCVGIHAWWPCTLLVWDAKCTCANICRTCWRDMDRRISGSG